MNTRLLNISFTLLILQLLTFFTVSKAYLIEKRSAAARFDPEVFENGILKNYIPQWARIRLFKTRLNN